MVDSQTRKQENAKHWREALKESQMCQMHVGEDLDRSLRRRAKATRSAEVDSGCWDEIDEMLMMMWVVKVVRWLAFGFRNLVMGRDEAHHCHQSSSWSMVYENCAFVIIC
jgi:hypothetical protein